MERDLVVFVPGITGSILYRADGTPIWRRSLWTVARGLASLPQTLAELTLPYGIGDEEPEPARRLAAQGLIHSWHAWPGVHTGAGYDGLEKLLRRMDPAATRIFAYDWGLSNRFTARRLGRQVNEWLDGWRHESGDSTAKVTFICHSMGGLIVRYLLEVLGAREIARKVVTLGTPFSGSLKAVASLTGDAYSRVPRYGGAITETARSFPSLYQLLPTYRCIDGGAEPMSLADYPIAALNDAGRRDGAAFHAEISAAVTRNGPAPYQLNVLVGKRHDTLQSVQIVSSERRRYLRVQRGTDHSGDGTVATFAAVPPEWHDSAAATMVAVRHGQLTSDAWSLETLAEKLSPIELGAVLVPDVELGIGLPDIAFAAEGIPIEASASRDDLLLHAAVMAPNSAEIVSEAEVPPLGDGRYATTITAPVGVWRVEVKAVTEQPQISTSDIVWIVE